MITSNFSFLTHEWADLYETAQKAESNTFSEPTISAFLCRKALEEMLTWLYDHDSNLELPNKDQFNLNDLLRERSFQNAWGSQFGNELIIVKNTGNDAAHNSRKVQSTESLSCVKILFRFCFFVVRSLSENPPEYKSFDESLIDRTGKSLSEKEIEKIRKEVLETKNIELERRTVELNQKEEELEKMRLQLSHYEQISKQNGEIIAPAVLSEKETRTLYIDVMLAQAGWDVKAINVQEFPVQSIDETTGKMSTLKADYVLWADNGKPLAVIEAKRTSVAVESGRNQAKNYADALQNMYGQRPFIFYTNGYDTYLWDDADSPPRKVFGFLSKDELVTRFVRKEQRKILKDQKVNQEIANRYYQERAIRKVVERFEDENQRRALLVMATGTGKTRVSAAIVDMLTKAQWAKKILFLADRTALVRQGKDNYNVYLGNQTSINLLKEEDEGKARIVFSTYQTIINKIDSDYRNNKRYYGIGHFDLVIIDEAHRSIYDKYGAIFEYFDALYLGLTATPKNETDRDTYALFNHQQGEPTDAYEYDVAIADEYLVPAKKVILPLKFPMQGIKYNDLSEEEKREWERRFYDPVTGAIIDSIDAGAINQWLFNQDTVDKVLQSLMDFGHKIEGGDKLGKTVIFARNHRHAEFIFERFYALYPEKNADFAKVIDNYDKNADKTIDSFKLKNNFPQIAISVDMLDTGIDVPEILNLVFFKPVYSAAKFWQMLGRGTRLCENIFGPGLHKENFYVFDVCGTFDFFEVNPGGIIPGKSMSITANTFISRAELVFLLQIQGDAHPDSEDFKLAKSLVDILQKQVSGLETNGFEVKMHLRQVEHYSKISSWASVNVNDLQDLTEHVASLINNDETNELVKRFDLMMVKMQLAILRNESSQVGYIEKLKTMAAELLRNANNVPSIALRKNTLQMVVQPEFWAIATIPDIEKVRIEMRDLSQLVELNVSRGLYYTNFQDELTAPLKVEEFSGSYSNFESSYAKLKKIILDNSNNLTIHKLHTNQTITNYELDALDKMLFEQSGVGTHEEFKKVLGDKPLGIFIRSILGLDRSSANAIFSSFLSNGPLSSEQINFINFMITQFTQNGKIEPDMLYESPFTKYHESGVSGIFPEAAPKIIQMIKETNQRAMVG
jgi:type I restriction enzyme, R subunit